MIYSNLLKKHYSDWPSLEKAIEALPTAKARGNVFEEFTFAYFTIKKQMYQIAEIYPSADIPDKYRKAFKLGNKQHQDSGVDGLIITNEGKSIAYQCKFRSGRVKPTYEELTKFWSDGRYCDYCCTVANSFAVRDVPIIDSVYFIDRKKSLVDIVQACGRALRTQNGIDKTAYFIIPILIPESSVAEEILNSEEFEIVYNIIQALRSQDNRLEDWINRLNNEYVRTGRIGSDCTDDDVPIIIQIEGIDIKQFSDELYVQIATVNANPDNIRRPTTFGAGERKTGHARIFKTIGDYAAERFFSSLVDPTIKIYKDKNSKCLSIADIKIDNNNISHTYRLGLIEKSEKNYSLTPLGEYYLSGRIKPQDLFRKQMLRYSNSLEDNKIAHTLFPYRACLEVLKNLEVKKLTFNEFAFCIYPMYDSTPDSIKRAVDDINYLRQKYPRLKAINIANRPQILQLLNTYFGTTLTITDIWGTAGTTVKNLYSYFKNHLSLFEDIIEIKNREICIKPGVNANDIDKLLEIDKNIEKVDRKNLFAIYTEVSSCL